jgi:hypothetical protein
MSDYLTVREVISEIKKTVKEQTADSRLTNKYIYGIIKKNAGYFVKQMSDALRIIRIQSLYQPLKCWEMEEAPTIDDCCGLRGKCTIYRTKEKLPAMYEDSYGAIIKSVKTIDHSKSYTVTTADSWLSKKNNPWLSTDKNIYYFFYNGRIYTPNVTYKKVEILAFFQEDISDIVLCDNCTDHPVEECRKYMDKKFMLTRDMWKVVSQSVVDEIVRIYKQIPIDTNVNKNERT